MAAPPPLILEDDNALDNLICETQKVSADLNQKVMQIGEKTSVSTLHYTAYF